ncbi:cobalamin biosynthesis [Micractinium conductrix]|uniref:Cobalamin biosynthesis n=1 Tax=Micractinium conductrix TaxID=554055 RepID=A0A2P6V4Z3_9CHLO|nr:cobalamin biosynthesis [Micractinium conductrix]|eukprot:PSC69152.1 cobalamin biosynthesis [Micractinium conductrix]
MDSRVPITVITGFLGSGKTTLVNRILTENHGKRIAIIENEFGEVGVDDGLVVETKEEVFEMNNGCICCTVRGDLIRILHKLLKRKNKFDAILIETTGLADPAPVAQTFFVDKDLKVCGCVGGASVRLDAILTVVDAKHIRHHLDKEVEEGAENEAVEQVAFADRLLLNKIDLVSEEEKQDVRQRLKAINGAAEIIECAQARCDLDRVLGIRAFDLERILAEEPQFLEDSEHTHSSDVTSVGIEAEGELDGERVQGWLSALLREKGADIFRSKGILCLAGSYEKYVFQGVHMLMSLASTADGVGRPWAPVEKRLNRLVFIGRNLDRQRLNASFRACLVAARAA